MPTRQSLYFTAPGQVEVCTETFPSPAAGEVLVETICSAISPGTEMLIYRGEFPQIELDANIESLAGNFKYPLNYGYACAGKITEIGENVAESWLGRQVFAFQPHTSHFTAKIQSLIPIPDGISPEIAAFLPNMETAVNLVQDAAPILGERVIIFGQGIIGLLTSSLLAQFPLETLVIADRYPLRREASLALGVSAALDPSAPDFRQAAQTMLKNGADLALELSGAPAALNDAIALTAFSGRIIVGSWYGEKRAPLDLGGTFHRSRIRLISSQVSTIAPELSARWDKSRRFETAWRALEKIQPQKWITQRFPLEEAPEAYRQLAESSAETIQILFTY